jgi:hypothetical protein
MASWVWVVSRDPVAHKTTQVYRGLKIATEPAASSEIVAFHAITNLTWVLLDRHSCTYPIMYVAIETGLGLFRAVRTTFLGGTIRNNAGKLEI